MTNLVSVSGRVLHLHSKNSKPLLCRFRSITAAIEQGRHAGTGTRTRTVSRSPPRSDGNEETNWQPRRRVAQVFEPQRGRFDSKPNFGGRDRNSKYEPYRSDSRDKFQRERSARPDRFRQGERPASRSYDQSQTYSNYKTQNNDRLDLLRSRELQHSNFRPTMTQNRDRETRLETRPRSKPGGHSRGLEERPSSQDGRNRRDSTLRARRSNRNKELDDRIQSLPYQTAASEFIYGSSSIVAAMKAKRRKFYKLYMHDKDRTKKFLTQQITQAGLGGIIEYVGEEYLPAMDKASHGRPHNGVVLEASSFPVLPISKLLEPSREAEKFYVEVAEQSAEDLAINGKQTDYSYNSNGWRHPLVLYVDGVLDEGNLGSIARSAYYLGVDALVTSSNFSASWSAIAIKASAGAAEALPIFKTSTGQDFLVNSAKQGWWIYASTSRMLEEKSGRQNFSDDGKDTSRRIIYSHRGSGKQLSANYCPVLEHPTILMLGGEKEGLRKGLNNCAHYNVTMPRGRMTDEIGVDSLNVGVAAGLLCHEFLHKPKTSHAQNPANLMF